MSKKRKTPYHLNRDEKAYIRDYSRRVAEEKKSEISRQVVEVTIVALGVAAYDELDLKGEPLRVFMRKFLNQFDCIMAGTVNLNDLRQILLEEADCPLRSLEDL